MRIYYLRRFRLIQCLLLISVGYWFAIIRKGSHGVNVAPSHRIHIGFVTDGQNLADMSTTMKTLFLHRQSLDFITFHVLLPKTFWSQADQIFGEWDRDENGLKKSFSYSLYDLAECESIQNTFEPYFDTVYRTAFCKLVFPYLVDPKQVPYLLMLDFDLVVVNNRFTDDCWLQTVVELESYPRALFSIAHQGSPLKKTLSFPMPYLNDYKAHFHFNNGIVLFHVARIHALDSLAESRAYPVSTGPRRWLRDVQHVALDYLRNSQQQYSLTQVVWNIYMAARPHCFVQLNQGCNFQPCAARTNVQMQDIPDRYPTIIIVHLWRACLKHKGIENDFFVSYYNALPHLPLTMINRINPTKLSQG